MLFCEFFVLVCLGFVGKVFFMLLWKLISGLVLVLLFVVVNIVWIFVVLWWLGFKGGFFFWICFNEILFVFVDIEFFEILVGRVGVRVGVLLLLVDGLLLLRLMRLLLLLWVVWGCDLENDVFGGIMIFFLYFWFGMIG